MTDSMNPYQSVPLTPAVRKPPLLPRQKSGARLAGILGFLILSLGFSMLTIPLAILAVVGLITVIIQAIGRTSGSPDWFRQLLVFVERLHPELWIIPLIVVAVIGAVVMAVALIVSARILKSHGIAKAWPVTWAAAGVAIVASWVTSGVLSVPLQIVSSGVDDSSGQALAWRIGVGILGFLVGIVTTAAIGWLSWWWMAHVMRPAADSDPGARDVGPAT